MSPASRRRRSQRLPAAATQGRAWTPAILFVASFGAGFLLAVPVRHRLDRGTGGEPEGTRGTARTARTDPAAAEARFQKGFALFREERYAEALEEFRGAAKLDPTDPRPHHGIGKIYKKLVLEDRAEQAFRRATEIDPGYLPSKKSLAMILHDLGEYDRALALLADISESAPDDPFVWAEIAINELERGDAGKAIELLEKYNAVEGRQAWGYAHLGRACAAAGDLDRAESMYREALSIDPRFTLGHYLLGRLLAEQGREDESRKVLGVYRTMRELQDREHQLRMNLLGDPDSINNLMNLSLVRFRLGYPHEALSLVERARKLAPEDERLLAVHEKVRRAAAAAPRPDQRGERRD